MRKRNGAETIARSKNFLSFSINMITTISNKSFNDAKKKVKQQEVDKQRKADEKAYRLCGFRGKTADPAKKELIAAKRRNQVVGKNSKKQQRSLAEFGCSVQFKRAPKPRPQPSPAKPPPPQDATHYASIELLRAGDVEEDPGPKYGSPIQLRCRATREVVDAIYQKAPQVCPSCQGRIFFLEKQRCVVHDVIGGDASSYKTREDARQARSESAVPSDLPEEVAPEEKGKEKEDSGPPEPPALPPRNPPSKPKPVPDEGKDLAKEYPVHALDGQRLSNAQLDEFGTSLGRLVVDKGGWIEKYTGERRLAPNRNVEELKLPIWISRAVFGSAFGAGWLALISFLSVVLCMFASIVFLDVLQLEGVGLAILTSRASDWTNNPYFWIVLRCCQVGVLWCLKKECEKASLVKTGMFPSWLPITPVLLNFVGIHVPVTICASVVLISHLIGLRKTVDYQWSPHIVSILVSEFMFSHSNGEILTQSLVLRAKRLACLPLNDKCHVKWMSDSITIAEFLITRQSHFSISPEFSANFVRGSDWT